MRMQEGGQHVLVLELQGVMHVMFAHLEADSFLITQHIHMRQAALTCLVGQLASLARM